MKTLLFVPGSLRAASASRATIRAVQADLPDDVEAIVADIGALPHYNADVADDPAVDEWKTQIADADGMVFVTPEYNYSLPGVLKNAIDWASRPAFESVFRGKPCFIISVSGGALGGVRAQSNLKYILSGMLAVPHVGKEIVIAQANAKVEDGKLVDATVLDFIREELAAFLKSLG